MKRISLVLLLMAVVFSSAFALDAPSLSAPTNNITKAYSRQTFQWTSVSGAGSYKVEIDTTTNFNSPLLQTVSTTETSTKIYDLHFGAHYYWRVRAISQSSSDVVSAWSPTWEFTTLSKTALVSPLDDSPTGTYYPKQTLKF